MSIYVKNVGSLTWTQIHYFYELKVKVKIIIGTKCTPT